jgi:short-chain fatty acids transporter
MLAALQRAGEGASRIAERWMPDAWVVCMALTVVAFALAFAGPGVAPDEAVRAWASGLWGLLTITMQFTLAVMLAYACVMSRAGFRFFDWLASRPNPERPLQAVLLMGVFSNLTGYLNWALCFVAPALFIPFLLRRNPKADARVIAAAAMLGVGTVTNGGLSGSAVLIMATPGNPLIAPTLGKPVVDQLYPITDTIFTSFNLSVMALLAGLSLLVVALLHPRKHVQTWSEERLRAVLPVPPEPPVRAATPAGRLENLPLWTWLAAAGVLYALGHSLATRGFAATWNINAYNAVFLALALVLHGNPLSFVRACQRGLGSAWGIVLQFPFYGGIFGLMTATALGGWMSELFVGVGSGRLFPLVVYFYSAALNFFVPSGGSKWLIEAPYLLDAARTLGVSPVTVLLSYVYGSSVTNLVHPYMAIGIISIAGYRFGEFAGYTFFAAITLAVVMTGAMLLIPLAF